MLNVIQMLKPSGLDHILNKNSYVQMILNIIFSFFILINVVMHADINFLQKRRYLRNSYYDNHQGFLQLIYL